MIGAHRINSLAKGAAAAAASTAITLDGSGDYYLSGTLSTSATDNKYLLFAAVVKSAQIPYPSGTNLQHIMNIYSAGGSWYIWVNGGRMQIDGVGGNIYEQTENSLSGSDWNSIVIYVDTSNINNCKFYINGTLKTLDPGSSASNSNFDWGSTTAVVKIGSPNSNIQGAGAEWNGQIAYCFVSNPSTFPGISNFWDSGAGKPKDLGTSGTATGLAQPLIYHYGNTSTFGTNNGTGYSSYTLTKYGNTADTTGPTYA